MNTALQRPIKVCRIAEAFPPSTSGLAPGVFDLSCAQANSSVELHVIAKDCPGAERFDKGLPFKVYRVEGRGELWGVNVLAKLCSLHSKENFDVLHVHGYAAVLGVLLMPLIMPPVPTVASVHCVRKAQWEALRHSGEFVIPSMILGKRFFSERIARFARYRPWLNRYITEEKLVYNRVDKLLPVAQHLKDELMHLYDIPSGKIQVIYNGVARDFCAVSENPDTCESMRLLFVGRLTGGKDLSPVIASMLTIVKEHSNAKLLIVGDGPLRNRYERLVAKLDLCDNVHFIGYIERDTLIKHYRSSHIFIFPSCSEGLPKVVMEAMACGKPVIASDIPGVRELVEHGSNGLLVPEETAACWAEHILQLLGDEETRKAMGERNRGLMMDEFSWESVARRCKEAYLDVLG